MCVLGWFKILISFSPTPSLPCCLVFFLQMLKDLPTSPPPCLLRSWSGCSTSSLPDLIDWPMWVEFNSWLVFGRSEGLHVELVERTQPYLPMSLPFCILSPGMDLWSSHILRINVSYLHALDGRFDRLIFPVERQLVELQLNQSPLDLLPLSHRYFPLTWPGAIQLQTPLWFMQWWWLPAVAQPTLAIWNELACSQEPVIYWTIILFDLT